MRRAGDIARMERKGMRIGFCWESLKERVHYEDLDVGGRIILKLILRDMGWNGMDWIERAKDRDQWTALVNTVMNLRVP
jgi:hypothetical protein